MQQYPEAFADGGLISYAGIILFGLLQWLKLTIIAAITLLVSSYARTNLFTVFV